MLGFSDDTMDANALHVINAMMACDAYKKKDEEECCLSMCEISLFRKIGKDNIVSVPHNM